MKDLAEVIKNEHHHILDNTQEHEEFKINFLKKPQTRNRSKITNLFITFTVDYARSSLLHPSKYSCKITNINSCLVQMKEILKEHELKLKKEHKFEMDIQSQKHQRELDRIKEQCAKDFQDQISSM